MNDNPLISICIPCFKRIEYVRHTLQSIYNDNRDVPLSNYEVVISDNDPDRQVEKLVNEFPYVNLKYNYTDCEGFRNSYYVLKYARGKFLKLHNSQVVFRRGALAELIAEVKANENKHSLIFYTNGFLYHGGSRHYGSFNDFFYALSYWPSWSNGFSLWKEDFDRQSNPTLNRLFPHTSLFITQWNKEDYILNDKHFFDTQRVKGRSGHNKFEAFTIEFPSLVEDCYKNGWITIHTKKKILHDIMTEFLPSLLFNKYLARIENFDISGYRDNIKRYFPTGAYWITWLCVALIPFRMVYRRIKQQ